MMTLPEASGGSRCAGDVTESHTALGIVSVAAARDAGVMGDEPTAPRKQSNSTDVIHRLEFWVDLLQHRGTKASSACTVSQRTCALSRITLPNRFYSNA